MEINNILRDNLSDNLLLELDCTNLNYINLSEYNRRNEMAITIDNVIAQLKILKLELVMLTDNEKEQLKREFKNIIGE